MSEFYPGCLVLVVSCKDQPDLVGKVGELVNFINTPGGYFAPDKLQWFHPNQSPSWFVEFPSSVVETTEGYSHFCLLYQSHLLPISGGDTLTEQEKDLVLGE